MAKREETYAQQRAKYKFFVVDVQHICIASGWEYREDALEEAVAADAEGRGPVKVMTKPAVGGQQLDPKDPASWVPRRNAGPAYASSARHVQAPRPTYQQHGPGRGVRQNPRHNPGELLVVNDGGGHDSARAERVYEMWHKRQAKHTAVIRPGCDESDVMVCVGNAFDIVYASNKWERNASKVNSYIHVFDSKPKVYMLAHLAGQLVDNGPRDNPGKTVGSLLGRVRNRDGQFAVAELARPESFSLDNGTDEGDEVAIHGGSKVYGAVDKRTVLITDPVWKLVVIRGGKMTFDERGIVK